MKTYSEFAALPFHYSGVSVSELLFTMDNLPLKPPMHCINTHKEDMGPDERYTAKNTKRRESQTRSKTQLSNALDRRVTRFYEAMHGKRPMTSSEIAARLAPTARTKGAMSQTRDSARSSLSRLIKTGHVKRIQKGKDVLFSWIAKSTNSPKD